MRKPTSLIVLSTILALTLNTALAAPPAQEPEGEPYIVQDGDWLSEIVQEQGTDNEFQHGDWLSKIAEEQGESYEIQDGDWLSKLAEEHYGDPLAYPIIIGATNAKAFEDSDLTIIDNPDLIEVGQEIWIPDEVPLAEASLAAVGIDFFDLLGLDKGVRAINKAIRTLDKNSKDWQVTLRELEADLIDAGQSALANEVPNLIETGIATTGTEIRCNTDFVANRLVQHLKNMKRRLKKEPEITLYPVICQVVPDAIDLRLEDKQLSTLEIYGYDFPTEEDTTETGISAGDLLQNGKIEAVLRDKNGEEHDVTDKIAFKHGYQMQLAIGGGTALPFTENSERLILRWEENGKKEHSAILILQPARPQGLNYTKVSSDNAKGQDCFQVCESKDLMALSPGTNPKGEPYYYCDLISEGPTPGFNLGNQCYVSYRGNLVHSTEFSCACGNKGEKLWDNEMATIPDCGAFCKTKDMQALSPGRWTGDRTRWFHCSDSAGRPGYNIFGKCVVMQDLEIFDQIVPAPIEHGNGFRCACGKREKENLDSYKYEY